MAEHSGEIENGRELLALSPLAAQAEGERRAGDLEQARRSAVAALTQDPEALGGRLVLALVLLDLGDARAAREEMERSVASLLPRPATVDERSDGSSSQRAGSIDDAELGDAELDEAFGQARSVAEEMHSVNDVAEAVLRDDSLVDAEDLADMGHVGESAEAADGLELFSEPAFATETMAALLEGQGDRGSAEVIRSALSVNRPEPADGTHDEKESGERKRLIATLEGWLANLRGASR